MSNTLGGILPGMSVVKIGGKRTIFQRATILNNMSRVRISVRPQKTKKRCATLRRNRVLELITLTREYDLEFIFTWKPLEVALHLWCYVYMHFWYTMHRQLWWCLVGVITIVQCIFGALFLGLGCNIFLVLRLWCYALPGISRRLATAALLLRAIH